MKTVLVVEDDDDIRELFVEVLQQSGYRAIPATNGKDALDILDALNSEPCLVLLDMMMPVMNGREFVEKLDGVHKLASLPVVVVSAAPGGIDGDHVRKIVRKPVTPEVLVEVVEQFCADAA